MASASAKPVLYSYWRSSCSWRVRVALALKGIDYEYRAIDLVKGQQKAAEFRRASPMGFVPALVHGDVMIGQSMAILEYIEEAFPAKKSLLPGTAAQRALIRSLAMIIVADIQPIQNLSVNKAHGGDDEEKKRAWAASHIERGFVALEAALAKTAGKYAVSLGQVYAH